MIFPCGLSGGWTSSCWTRRAWPGTWCRRAACSPSWRAHRAEVFPGAGYADPDRGRPSVPATQMAAVMTLQALRDYSGREAAGAAGFDVRWKVAISASLADAGFDPSTLVYRRQRIAGSGRPHRVGGAVKKVIGETAVLKGRRRRAVDSTILAGGVAAQDTVTRLVSAIRRVAREVPGAAEQVAAVCTGHDCAAPGKPKIGWDDPAREGRAGVRAGQLRECAGGGNERYGAG